MVVKTLGILALVALSLGTATAVSLGTVDTEGGRVEGENIRLGFRRHMDVFKGIPFADMPGRFEKPKPHTGWDSVLKATEYAKRCLQVNLLQTSTRGSEDCLYLNIWVPHGKEVSTGLPVMVWIFGGGFLVGGSMGANFLDNYLYSGQEIADRGDVIVVTVAYRVGTLGFLSSGDASGPGNYGLWDQQAAIAWVHRNIRSFGGDPDNITLFGESAGGASVSLQTVSPHNKGLIRRAISQSGVALCPWAINRNPRHMAEMDPGNLFHNAADIDYIAGDMRALLGAYTKDKGKAGQDTAFSQYTSDWGNSPSKETVKRTVVDIGTDYIFLVPSQAALYLHASNANTYSYLLSEPNRLGGLAKPYPSWMGADHADDLQYMFGKPFSSPLGYWPRHRRLSGYMIAYWTNFARTGDPNKGLDVPATWPKFTPTGHKYLDINAKMDRNSVRQKMRMRFVHFWTSVLPSLHWALCTPRAAWWRAKTSGWDFVRRMDVFKGVPFADIPGRFEKPKRHPGWDGHRVRKRCLQVNLLQTGTRGSEDCLYLNIWVPHGRHVSTGLPVMVWIFGGGFLVGGSMGANFLNNYLYSGQEIADRGDVIVVTVAYRVGTLGFLSSGDASGPGNYGLWDQQAAIAWVHRNIRSFGGDPDNITLFGESAGGASVSLQTVSPHNKGLIRRAISQSGVALCPWAINRNPRHMAEMVNCPIDDTMMSCLKMIDAAALTLAGTLSVKASPENPLLHNLLLSAVIDGDFLPEDPGNLFHNAADIDYIAGVNDMDGHLFTGLDIPSINSPLVATSVEDMRALLGAYTKDKGKAGQDTAFSQYTSDWGNGPSQETVKRTVVDIGTDYIFLVPSQAALYLHASNANTYSYLLSEPNRLGGLAKPYPSWMGAEHADDLQYMFGKPFSSPLGYWPRHRRLSGYMIAYWTNFAKTGDPNKGLDVPATWPKFTPSGHKYLEINGNMDRNSVRQKMRMRFVHFWTSVLPSLQSVKMYE
ncbi:hypothetical protein CRUP_005207 [Coryphaenoides rupestris]|nr:hypothetical protein CRUP_005207 [Coryphaenoides rupestris]